MGRTSANPRYNVISFRATEEEYWEVVAMAQTWGISFGEAARLMMFGDAI